MSCVDRSSLQGASQRLFVADLPDLRLQAALLRPALLSRYDPIVVESALYLYQAEILPRDLIYRYCNKVDPSTLADHLELLEYDGFLMERLVYDQFFK